MKHKNVETTDWLTKGVPKWKLILEKHFAKRYVKRLKLKMKNKERK